MRCSYINFEKLRSSQSWNYKAFKNIQVKDRVEKQPPSHLDLCVQHGSHWSHMALEHLKYG